MNEHLAYFKELVEPLIPASYVLTWTEYLEGDFGDLKRLEFSSSSKIGAIDFWSKDWLAMDVVDLDAGDQVLNVLYSPDQMHEIPTGFARLLEMLSAS
ncbi:hypothetical protein [Undibacterium sp. YM2]|uniref:hypothetical protein n=1 Tax=Undibacterium sp. YM2 TaxID=2058625 RepID=UPI0013899323|nr:hypothetical protein [Undibacterium sp. YM2]